MNKLKNIAAWLFVGLTVVALGSCGDDPPPDEPKPTQNIYEIVSAKAGYDLTIQAIDKAGLKALLTGSASLTFFPPSDDAILAAGLDVNSMSAAELKSMLEYHIINGSRSIDDLPKGGYLTSRLADSVNGRPIALFFDHPAGVIEVNGFQSIQTIEATNGHVHFMNDALEPLSVYGHLAANTNLALYRTAVQLDGVHRAKLESAVNYTVFAANKEAMEAFISSEGVTLPSIHPDKRRALLYNSTIEGSGKFAADLSATETTLGLDLATSSGGLKLNGTINVVTKNIQCTNGVIHIVDSVIMP